MSTDWVFTDYSQLDESFWTNWFNEGDLQYLACQVETCPSTGQLHIQGFVIFKNRKRLVPTLKRIDPTRHWEKRKSSLRQAAANYATKHDTRSGWTLAMGEFDELEQGKRNDLEEIKQMVMNGATDREIAIAHFASWMRYSKAIKEFRSLLVEPRTWVPEVYVFWGDTGTGKTRAAVDLCGEKYYMKESTHKWWDGYDGVSPIIIDDFMGGLDICYILRLCDRYKMQVEVKGGSVQFAPKLIVFTSNSHPQGWWPAALNYNAFERRCKEIKKIE